MDSEQPIDPVPEVIPPENNPPGENPQPENPQPENPQPENLQPENPQPEISPPDENRPEDPVNVAEDLKQEAEDIEVQEPEQDSNLKNVHVTLKDLSMSGKGGLSLSIADNLMLKDSLEKTKFNCYKQKVKANELNELQEAPTINKRSHRFIGLKEEKAKKEQERIKNIKYDKYDEDLILHEPQERLSALLKLNQVDVLNANTMKASIEARGQFQGCKKLETEKKNKLIEKCKQAEFKNLSKNEEGKSKSVKELKKGNSLYSAPSVEGLGSRVPPPNRQYLSTKQQPPPSEGVIISDKYAQLTPYAKSMKYGTGYNSDQLLAKCRPMVDYKMQIAN